uniref:Uncharacterized protein n=1 Tax=Acrobeloides nanus TaxID=290746 RepID=A0A914CHW6_9BILA
MEPMSSGLFMGLFVMIFPVIVSVFFCLFFEEKNYMENLIESIFFIFTIRAPDALVQESQAWYEVLILTACSSIGAILVTSMVWRVSYDLIIGLSWFGSDERALYNMRNP